MLVALDYVGGEPVLKEMTDAVVAPIEALCVQKVEAMHPGGKMLSLGLDDQMVVVRHQAVRVDLPSELANHLT
jgi:hypothetical protein